MEAFAEKLKASAVQAAKVAQNLATTGFDEMAATDEYVQSEGYNNVAAAAAAARQDPRVFSSPSVSQQQQMDLLQDDTSTLSTTSSSAWLRQREASAVRHRSSVPNGSAPLSRMSSSSQQPQQNVVPLKVNVPERKLSTTSGIRQEENASVLSSDDNNDDDSSVDDDYEDPIMSFVRKQHNGPQPQPQQQQQNAQQQRETAAREGDDDDDDDDESSFSERHLPSSTDQGRKKTNRFMDDLESRLAKPVQDEHPPEQMEGPRVIEDNTSSVADVTMLTSWLSTAATYSMRLSTTTRNHPSRPTNLTVAPLARNNKRSVASQHNDGLDNVAIVSSTAMLGDAEMQELAQLRQHKSAKCELRRRVLELLQQHPREAFVAFTLLLGSFAYFYSNNRSLEE